MSMISKLIVVAVLFAIPFSAKAADELLNGGDMIACPGLEVPAYRSLDLYEGEKIYNLKPALVQQSNFKVILSQLIDRVEKYDLTRANLYRSFLRNFDKEVHWVEDSEFGNIRDEGWIALPQGCELKQVAAQFRQHTPDGIKYIINGSVWMYMSPSSKAALIMHEFIYREGLLPKNDFKNSARVRYFNAFIHSAKLTKASYSEYQNAVKFAGFKN